MTCPPHPNLPPPGGKGHWKHAEICVQELRSAGQPLLPPGKSGAVTQTLRIPHAVGADVTTVRVRHSTSVGNLAKIQEGNILLAGDQGRVFAMSARGKPPSPRDVEKALRISRGRENACVDFDAVPEEFERRVNTLTGAREFVFRGDIDLTHRQAHFSRNR